MEESTQRTTRSSSRARAEAEAKGDPFNLERFVSAQNDALYKQVLDELKEGEKQSCWMWFIFPQRHGYSKSARSLFYGIKSDDEARAYMEHPTLGPRLVECTELVLNITGKSLNDIFSSPDDGKFHACMELFSSVSKNAKHKSLFEQGLLLQMN